MCTKSPIESTRFHCHDYYRYRHHNVPKTGIIVVDPLTQYGTGGRTPQQWQCSDGIVVVSCIPSGTCPARRLFTQPARHQVHHNMLSAICDDRVLLRMTHLPTENKACRVETFVSKTHAKAHNGHAPERPHVPYHLLYPDRRYGH